MTLPANIEVQRLSRAERNEYDALLSSWLETLTENAKRSYQSDLEHFAAWIGAPDVETAMQALFTLDAPNANAVVLRYRKHLLTTPVWSRGARARGEAADRSGYAPATVNRRLAALRSVARIARITGVFKGTIEIRGVKVASDLPTKSPIGHEHYLATMASIEAQLLDDALGHRDWWLLLRDRAILRMLHDMMLRRVEVQRMLVEDVDIVAREVVVRSKGARGRLDVAPLSKRAETAVHQWINERGTEPGALFGRYDAFQEKLNLSTINRMVLKRSLDAHGVECRPHDLRRIAITTALDRTRDLRGVAGAARHRNPATTMRYDQGRIEAVRDVSDAISD